MGVKKPKKKKHDISGVSSVGLTSDVPLNSHEFNKFMHGIIKDHKENLYRTKGVVALAGEGDTKFVFQGVHDQIQFTPAVRVAHTEHGHTESEPVKKPSPTSSD